MKDAQRNGLIGGSSAIASSCESSHKCFFFFRWRAGPACGQRAKQQEEAGWERIRQTKAQEGSDANALWGARKGRGQQRADTARVHGNKVVT